MDIAELRKQEVTELNNTLMDLLKQHFELRMQHSSAELKDHSQLTKVKKSIAQVKTIVREKC